MSDPSPDTPPIFRFATIDSTNTEAFRAAERGAPHGSAFLAEFQTAGRGKPGSEWWMPPGAGVLLSVLLRQVPATIPFESMSVEIGRRLADRIRELTGLPVQVKPPNDLLVGGKKFSGILCEARWRGDRLEWVVVGVGIDVNVREFPEELRATATSLALAAGRDLDVETVAMAALDVIRSL